MNPIRKLIGEAEDFSEYEDLLKLDAEQEKTLFNRVPVLTPGEAYEEAKRLGKNKVTDALEKRIALSEKYSFMYAATVLRSRFPLGEPIISKNPYWSYLYALKVVKLGDFIPNSKRFPPGENVIANDAYYSFMYATEALHNRFPAGEYAIAQVKEYRDKYKRHFKLPGWAGIT